MVLRSRVSKKQRGCLMQFLRPKKVIQYFKWSKWTNNVTLIIIMAYCLFTDEMLVFGS